MAKNAPLTLTVVCYTENKRTQRARMSSAKPFYNTYRRQKKHPKDLK